MADKKDKKPAATFGSIALQNYAAQRGYEVGQDASLGETLKPAVELLGNYAENAIAERAKFIDNLPEDYEVELLPVDSREAFTNFASDAKQRYSDAAGVAAKYSANPNSEQYREAVKRMEDIKKGLSTNFSDYTKLADIRKKYTNNHGNEVALTDEQEVMYTDIIQGKNFQSTPNGLVYNRKDLDGNTVEQIPINDLPTIDYIDPELGTNMVTNVLDNPYAKGLTGSDMQTTLSNANVQIQNLTSTPDKLKQAIFNGFGGEKTKFINYYVGENLINEANATFLAGINDIDGDGKITKDDMQEGVWSFKDDDAGNAARTLFEGTIKAHKNDPDFINNKELNVRQKLNSFMSDIAKDKYLEGQANKFKNTTYNIKGIGSRNHDQIQDDFDKLNNHEKLTTYGGTELTPVEGKPGFYTRVLEDGSSVTLTRDVIEKALDIFSIRGDFNTDPVKATTTTTATATDGNTTESETTTSSATDNAENDGASGATIKVDPPEEGEFRGNVDYTNQSKKQKPKTSEIGNLKAKLSNIYEQATSGGLENFNNPTLKDELEEQIILSDAYIKAVDDVYIGTGIIDENGVMKAGIPFISNESFGGRGKLHKKYNKEKERNQKLREKYANLPEPVGSMEPAEVKREVQNIPSKTVGKVETNLNPSIDAIEAGEVELKDTNLDVVVGSKEAVKGKASYNKTLGDSLISNEGFRENMYYDMATDEDPTAGTPTIGYGYTKEALDGKDGVPSWTEYWNADGTPTGKKMTEEVADSIKETIVNRYVKQVNSDIKVDLTESQNNALVDLYYRNGAGNVAKSGIIELINAGKIKEAAELIKAGGKNGRLIKAGSKVLAEGDRLYKGINDRNNRAAENLLAGLETQDQTQA